MKKIFKHLIYCVAGIILVLGVYWLYTKGLEYFESRSPRGKMVIVGILAICVCIVMYGASISEAREKHLNDTIYQGYEHYNDPSSAELDARARRRENGTMTSDDFN